jgi:hypothetical protein
MLLTEFWPMISIKEMGAFLLISIVMKVPGKLLIEVVSTFPFSI